MAPTGNAKARRAAKRRRNANPGKEAQPATPGNPSTSTSGQPKTAKKPDQSEAPRLEPWMRQTVVLKLKEVEGRRPDMTEDIFTKKMVIEQGFSMPEVSSISCFFAGIFYITFASINICRRYWEVVKSAGPDSPFSNFLGGCPVQREERRVTVSIRNPHVPGQDISTFLKRFCTVVKEPAHILNGYGFWNGRWSVIVKLHKDSSSEDGFQHLPQAFTLGNSPGLIYYSDMPQICRKCGKKGHQMRDCKEDACRFCHVTGHETKDCPKKKTCNLCGLAAHRYKDCPKRERTWAKVAAKAPAKAAAPAAQKPQEKQSGKRTAPPPSTPTLPCPPPPTPRPSSPAPRPSSPARRPPSPPKASPPAEVLPIPQASVVIAATPAPTLPPCTSDPSALISPPELSEVEYPPLSSAGPAPRKRKERGSPVAGSSKKLMVKPGEESLCEEQQAEEEKVTEVGAYNASVTEIPAFFAQWETSESFDQWLESLQVTGNPAGGKEEDPPDVRSGN